MPPTSWYEQTLVNEYLGKSRTVRARTHRELDLKVWEVQRAWAEQEQRKREADARQEKRRADAEGMAWQRAAAQEDREERRAYVDARKGEAERLTAEAQEAIAAYNALLAASLGRDSRLHWGSLADRRKPPRPKPPSPAPRPPTPRVTPGKPQPVEPPAFAFDETTPSMEAVRHALRVPPRRPVLEAVLRSLRRKREALESKAEVRLDLWRKTHAQHRQTALEAHTKACQDCAQRNQRAEESYAKQCEECSRLDERDAEQHEQALAQWRAAQEEAGKEYEQVVSRFKAEQRAHNAAVRQLRTDFEQGEAAAVKSYVEMVLGRSAYPDGIAKDLDVDFEPVSATIVIAYQLPAPTPDALPRAIEFRYVASRDETKRTDMKPKEFEAFYEDVLQQIVLRTIHEVFQADYARHVQSVVFNGWVHGVDPKTGKDFDSCIISCQASREQFEQIDLSRVSPKDCLRGLHALDAGPLAQLAPVRPIFDLKRTDSRFVESREVLADLNSSDNLAEMDWEDFERLVRELFGKMFSTDGAEVRITQASRDRGVDAIAFDPDPIRGGKFVIQAKRYNIVVPVSAVRDLYGTVINEGAVKGILVTTSYYGHDSREFAKDKPLTLIDGSNLVYLFQQFGYDVRIDLRPTSPQD